MMMILLVGLVSVNNARGALMEENSPSPQQGLLLLSAKERRKLLNDRNASKSSSFSSNKKKRDLTKEQRIDLKRKDNISPKGLYV